MDRPKQMRFVVVGAKQVGKTALTVRYLTKRFLTEYVPGTDTAYTHNTIIGGNPVTLNILDSSGKNSAILAWADGLIVVYSVDSKKSFKKAIKLIDELKCVNLRGASVALVGNKTDLLLKRQVAKVEGEEYALSSGSLFFEVSASQEIKAVQTIFDEVYTNIIKSRCGEEKRNLTPNFVRKMFRSFSGNSLRDRSGTI